MEPKQTSWSFAFWCLGFVALFGIHRFYMGKWGTGLLWLLTGGFFLIGQIIDLFLIPGMVERTNRKLSREGRLVCVGTPTWA
ncbi:MAG: NINE protein [Phycisphaerales bacterium]|nr:NINE protein [Phycisphaerales bacterium]